MLVRETYECDLPDWERDWCYEQFQDGKGFLPKTFDGHWECECDDHPDLIYYHKQNHRKECKWIEGGPKVPQKYQKGYERV